LAARLASRAKDVACKKKKRARDRVMLVYRLALFFCLSMC